MVNGRLAVIRKCALMNYPPIVFRRIHFPININSFLPLPPQHLLTRMIPKLIHQTWKSSQVPGKWIPFVEKVKKLNPGWSYQLWTDNDNDAFVKTNFPEFYPVFKGF